MKKWVYTFGEVAEAEKYAGSWDGVRGLLGGKGANLAEMTNLGIPVPPGFTISTAICAYYYQNKKTYPKGFMEEVKKYVHRVEKSIGKKFGDRNNPLLVSVRSGAAISMPGMMDTILNLGLNDIAVEGLLKQSNNPRFAYDAYRRFIQMFSDVVLGIEKGKFEHIIDKIKEKKGVKLDIELSAEDWKDAVRQFKALFTKEMGKNRRGFDNKNTKRIEKVFKGYRKDLCRCTRL